MRFRTAPLLLALASFLAWPPAHPASAATAASDAPDRFQLAHFPGSKAIKRANRNFDEYWVALGKLRGDGQADDYRVIEGRWTHLTLSNPEGRSVAEIYKHYEQRLAAAGFDVLYSCKDVECGEG